jgi:hypothetical protein
MKLVTVADFINLHGVTQELTRGRWKPWDKLGVWELKGRNIHVIPLIWDEVSGTAWVQMPEGCGSQRLLVRVENIVRYRTALTDSIGDGGNVKQPRATSTKSKKNLPTTAEELLKALGM